MPYRIGTALNVFCRFAAIGSRFAPHQILKLFPLGIFGNEIIDIRLIAKCRWVEDGSLALSSLIRFIRTFQNKLVSS